MICTPNSILVITKSVWGGAWGTYGGQESCIQRFGGVTRGKEITCKT